MQTGRGHIQHFFAGWAGISTGKKRFITSLFWFWEKDKIKIVCVSKLKFGYVFHIANGYLFCSHYILKLIIGNICNIRRRRGKGPIKWPACVVCLSYKDVKRRYFLIFPISLVSKKIKTVSYICLYFSSQLSFLNIGNWRPKLVVSCRWSTCIPARHK